MTTIKCYELIATISSNKHVQKCCLPIVGMICTIVNDIEDLKFSWYIWTHESKCSNKNVCCLCVITQNAMVYPWLLKRIYMHVCLCMCARENVYVIVQLYIMLCKFRMISFNILQEHFIMWKHFLNNIT